MALVVHHICAWCMLLECGRSSATVISASYFASPGGRDIDLNCTSITKMGEIFIWRLLARVHDEGRLRKVEQLEMQVVETGKTKLG
jgi:hypothetical protein